MFKPYYLNIFKDDEGNVICEQQGECSYDDAMQELSDFDGGHSFKGWTYKETFARLHDGPALLNLLDALPEYQDEIAADRRAEHCERVAYQIAAQ